MDIDEDVHYYGTELNLADPLALQPCRVKMALKPHQQAALAKAMKMEREGTINYDIPPRASNRNDAWRTSFAYRGKMKVNTNVGILGDLVGYGKTLTALGIIAATPTAEITRDATYYYSSHGRHIARFTAICDRPEVTESDKFFNTTLVVVPRGPVFVQWQRMIEQQTDLRLLSIDSLPTIRKKCPPTGSDNSVLKEFFEQYDIVLIKNTTIRTLIDYYEVPYHNNPIVAWNRIMIDEAHDIIKSVPLFDYKFLWLITATYYVLPQYLYGGRTFIVGSLRDVITEDNMPFLLVRGNLEFVRNSFYVPDLVEHYYMCQLPRQIGAVQPFLNSAALERVNANDIAGAIRELGGTNETEQDIVELVTRDIQKDIRNKEREIEYVQGLDVAADYRQSRINTLTIDLHRLQEKLQALTERVSHLSTKTCGICFDSFENPIVLPCTHVFCGGCLIKWMRNNKRTCPECRTEIKCNRLIAVVDQKSTAVTASPRQTESLDKVDTLINIIRNKPAGRFLVFSRVDSSFYKIMNALDLEGISYAEIKGSTSQMMRILQRFQDRQLQVILLNTHHAGSGIDISCATDVVIFHQMGPDKVQAVGRAQRVGRTTNLFVHNLCYPHEM